MLTAMISFTAQSQITLTDTDFPPIGNITTSANDTAPAPGILPGNAGTNLTWAYSALNSHDFTTETFVAPASTAFASFFPTATHAVTYSNNNNIIYFKLSPADIQVMGYVIDFQGTLVPIAFSNSMTVITFDVAYGNSYIDTATYSVTLPYVTTYTDSMRLVGRIIVSSDVDAWGAVTTPENTYNVLREYRVQHSHDSIYAHNTMIGWMFYQEQADTTISYNYWGKNGFGIATTLASLTMDNAQPTVVESASYYTTSTDIISFDETGLLIYPNPAKDQITIENVLQGITGQVRIINLLGQEMFSIAMNGANRVSIPVSHFPEGIYFAEIITGQNKTMKKFMVKR